MSTRRGSDAKNEIVREAMRVASVDGLDGLTLGTLASQLGRSKSGLFAHFDSKEALQIQVIHAAARSLVDEVVVPAIRQPRGMPRIEAMFEAWDRWALKGSQLPGGCIFVQASVEYDDKPGPVRDVLVNLQLQFQRTLARAVQIAIDEGHVQADTDPEQLAFEWYGIMLASHHYGRLLGDKQALHRARAAFHRLMKSVRA